MNWYQRRLSGQGQAPNPPPATPPPTPTPAPTPAPTPTTQRPPQSSFNADHCPGCGSVNYMAPQGTQAKRCFDCGYPIQQSGSGVGTVGTGQTDGTVHRATQVQSGGYQPGTIVGRVD